MSLVNYTVKVIKSMTQKIGFMENYNYNEFMRKDEYFELAMCLAYLTLSKEKIIDKETKNTDRIGRLTKKVEQSEIDKVFTPGFASRMPKIIEAKENNNLWILDDIRDSIMHCKFDIDDEKRILKINNTQPERKLLAEIPYEWIIAYAKNDILKKRMIDKYSVKGFYYNERIKDVKYFNTKNEILHNIMYNAIVTGNGNKFNVRIVENRIRELFEEYSKEEVTPEDVRITKPRMYKHLQYFDPFYLTSYIKAKDKVLEKIQEEFPDLTIKIFIDNRKKRILDKVNKGLLRNYRNYNVLYKTLNESVSMKGIALLENLSSIISEIGNIKHDSQMTSEENYESFNNLFKQYNESDKWSVRTTKEKNLKTLREIFLTVFGISTLVINHKDIYTNYYEYSNSNAVGLITLSKQKTEDFCNEFKKLISELLRAEKNADENRENQAKCNKQEVKEKLQLKIDYYELIAATKKAEINNLVANFESFELAKNEKEKLNDFYESRVFLNWLQNKYKEFKALPAKEREPIIKEIKQGIDDRKEKEINIRYGYVTEPEEWLIILRNCLSHVGRITIGRDYFGETQITLNDYENNNTRSGIIFTKYYRLLDVLTNPFMSILSKELDSELEEKEKVQGKKLTP